jgi:hypothetical protein
MNIFSKHHWDVLKKHWICLLLSLFVLFLQHRKDLLLIIFNCDSFGVWWFNCVLLAGWIPLIVSSFDSFSNDIAIYTKCRFQVLTKSLSSEVSRQNCTSGLCLASFPNSIHLNSPNLLGWPFCLAVLLLAWDASASLLPPLSWTAFRNGFQSFPSYYMYSCSICGEDRRICDSYKHVPVFLEYHNFLCWHPVCIISLS